MISQYSQAANIFQKAFIFFSESILKWLERYAEIHPTPLHTDEMQKLQLLN